MKHWFKSLDDILRGRATSPDALRDGQIDIPVRELAPVLIQLGAFYGFCMGWYAILNHDDPQYMQIWASMLKVPLLFFLTLLVTLPSLYIFNALVGSRLSIRSIIGLMFASLGVVLAVLAAFGPIVAFFSLTTTSYSFMKLFNVLLFAIAAGLGLRFLHQTLHRATGSAGVIASPTPRARTKSRPAQAAPVAVLASDGTEARRVTTAGSALDGPGADPVTTAPAVGVAADELSRVDAGALERIDDRETQRHVRRVFTCWTVLFALVGGQMSWVLRPFIGEPGVAFTWFRERESNFLEAVVEALHHLLR
jgi:hypothetical protein